MLTISFQPFSFLLPTSRLQTSYWGKPSLYTYCFNSQLDKRSQHLIKPTWEVATKDKYLPHRLKMELDLQSLFGLHVHSCTHWLRHRIHTPHPPHLDSYTRAPSLWDPLSAQKHLQNYWKNFTKKISPAQSIYCAFPNSKKYHFGCNKINRSTGNRFRIYS